MKLSVLIEVALFGTIASSLALDAPLPTATKSLGSRPLQPALYTMPPMAGGLDLLKRNYEATLLVAPDNRCGFFSANTGTTFKCDVTATCNLFLSLYTQASTAYGAVGCCQAATCAFKTTCIGLDGYAAGTRCLNDFCTYCTATDVPFCNYVSVVGANAVGVYCESTTISTYQAVVTGNIQYSIESFVVTQTSSSSVRSSSIATSPALPSTVSSAAASTAAQTSGSSPGTPVGAIAGGVVGGIAVLAIIGGIIFFLIRKKRRQAAQNAQTTGQPQYPPYNPNQGASMAYAQQPPYNSTPGPFPGGQVTSPQYMSGPPVAPAAWEQTENQKMYGQSYGMQNLSPQSDKAYDQTYVTQAATPTHDPRDSILSSPGSSTYGSSLPGYGSPPPPAHAFEAPNTERPPAQLDGRGVYPVDEVHEISYPVHKVHEISG